MRPTINRIVEVAAWFARTVFQPKKVQVRFIWAKNGEFGAPDRNPGVKFYNPVVKDRDPRLADCKTGLVLSVPTSLLSVRERL